MAKAVPVVAPASKGRLRLGWMPEISLYWLIDEMVATDSDEARKHALLKLHGFPVNASAEQYFVRAPSSIDQSNETLVTLSLSMGVHNLPFGSSDTLT